MPGRIAVTLLGVALVMLANGLLTNALFGAPKGVYLFVGKTYATDGVFGQAVRAVRGYSSATITQGGMFSMDPCNNEGTLKCVGIDFAITGTSVVPFDFDPKSVSVRIGGETIAAGSEASKAGLADSYIDGPVRVGRGTTVSVTARVAVPHVADGRRTAVVLINGLDEGASWRHGPSW